jgi:hypothetical protein
MVWQAIVYYTNSNTNFSNKLLANFSSKFSILEVLHNSKNFPLGPLNFKLTMFYCNLFISAAGLSLYNKKSQVAMNVQR